jgi:hypothetical protein
MTSSTEVLVTQTPLFNKMRNILDWVLELVPGCLLLFGLMHPLGRAVAETLLVSTSGVFGSSVTTGQLTGPNQSWAMAFDVDGNPAATNTDSFGFDAPFSNFSYLLNGSPVAASPESIRFYTDPDGGLFTIFFGPEAGFSNGLPIPEFSFSGNSVFSETTTNPSILPGSYPISDALYSDAINFDDEGASGTVSITTSASTVPEPCSFLLLLTAGLLCLIVQLRQKRARPTH